MGSSAARAAAFSTILLALAPAGAAADATIVKGGPKAERARVEAALAEASAAMGVCWRGSPPPTVKVKLAVAADGAVTATAIGRGGAAQCAAGVLAVWTLPGGAWSGEVEIGAGAGPQDLSATIQQRLVARGATIKECQSRAPAAAGPVGIKMKIHPDGSITDVEVSSSLGAAIDGCVKKAVAAMKLEAIGGSGPIRYALAVAFAGNTDGGGGAGGGGPVAGEEPDGGSVGGALPADKIKGVIDPARRKLTACGSKGRGRGKVVTRFTIRPDGTTKNVVVKEGIGDKAIEDCLVAVFKALRFPTASAETKVVYPVGFYGR